MDKLEPIIRYRFWIILGLAIPLALAGYYSASGGIKDETTKREEALTQVLNGVSKGDEPNDTYSDGLSVINADLKKRNAVAVQELWEMQTARMTWPPQIQPYIPHEYRGEIPDNSRYGYREAYRHAIARLWKSVQPYVGEPRPTGYVIDWPEKVVIQPETIPRVAFPKNYPPESEDIWDAQEDIWLIDLLFEAIVRTNENATYVGDAIVRRIDRIELMGGTGVSSVVDSGTTMSASAGGMSGFGSEEYEDYEDYEDDMDMGGGFGEQGGPGPGKIDFDVTEEFGDPVPIVDEEASTPAASSTYGGPSMSMGSLASAYGARGARKFDRYIGDEEGKKFRERGFYMSVIVDQSRLPEFFAELCSSDWPIKIGRFHIGPNPYYKEVRPGYPAGGFGLASQYGGFGGGYGDYEEEMEDYDEDSFGGYTFGGSAYSGMLGSMGAAGAKLDPLPVPTPNPVDENLLSHPDLVQVDFCGRITMYKPMTSDDLIPESDGSTPEETAVPEESAAPEEAAGATDPASAAEGAAAPVDESVGTPAEAPPAAAEAPGASDQ